MSFRWKLKDNDFMLSTESSDDLEQEHQKIPAKIIIFHHRYAVNTTEKNISFPVSYEKKILCLKFNVKKIIQIPPMSMLDLHIEQIKKGILDINFLNTYQLERIPLLSQMDVENDSM